MFHRFYAYFQICVMAIFLLEPTCLSASDNDDHQEHAEVKQHILILNSYNQGYAWTDNEVKGIQNVFSKHDDIVLRIEYMDTKVINDSKHYAMLAELYARKYKNLHIDVIITTDDDAFTFMTQYRKELFPNIPLVFAGVNNYSVEKARGLDNFTGINESYDFAKNIELINHILPSTREVMVISDDLTDGKALLESFKAVVQESNLGLSFHYLTGLTMEQLESRLAQLKPHQAVFYLSFFRDGNGIPYAPTEAIPVLAQASAVPMFGAMDYMAGKGILGGLMETAEEQGEHAALKAEQIMAGTSASQIPVLMHSSHKHKYVFDYQQLRRFGISRSKLPKHSVLINEPETFYYHYKTVIWSIALVFSILLAYIGALLVNIRQRTRTQKGLQSILETSHTLFDISAHQQFKHRLLNNLESLLPNAQDIFLMRYKGKSGEFNEADLAIVGADQTTPINESAKNLIADAIRESRCVYSKNEAVAKLDTINSPVNMFYVNGSHKLDKTDQQLFELFAGNVAMSIDNAETYKLSASLQTAHRIQAAMLPTDFSPASRDYELDLHAFIVPAKEVGGDLYDFFALDEDNICLLVGDVSDKGVPAAIFMAMAKTILRSTADIDLSPAEVLFRANNELSRNNPETMFVTLFLVMFNRKTGMLSYSDGGHNAPYLIQANGEVKMLKSRGGTALGVMEDLPYYNGELHLDRGDGLLMYTDGVTEAANENNRLYGEERLLECLIKNSGCSSQELNALLLQNLGCFTGEAAQSDDITSMMFRRGAG